MEDFFLQKVTQLTREPFLSIPRRFRSDMVEMYFEFFQTSYSMCVSCAKNNLKFGDPCRKK
jgi:hypothetical protein